MPISKEDIPFDDIDFNDIPATREQLESWIEKHGDKLDDIRELWLDLDVKVLSTVENPSHDSNVVRTKEDGSKVREVTALKSTREKAEEKQIIEAPAMVADEKDKDGDVPPDFVVEEAAHDFLRTERVDSVDADHETPLNAERSLTDRGTVVESWILEDEKEFETVSGEKKTYGSGDWMVAIELEDETWERFQKGELTGLSIMGVPEKKVEFKSSDPIQSGNNGKDMTEESEIKMPDADEIRSELEQYNVDTSGMNDEDLMEFAEALHDDLMDELTDEEDSEESMDGDDEDEEEQEVEEEVEEQEEPEEENLDDPEFSEGDAVMWSSNDTPVHGRVNDIHEQYSPAEGVTITGEEGEAVYSIFEYDDSLETPVFRNSPSDPNIAKPESSLSESQMDMPPASEENFEVEEESQEESEEESEQVEEQESEEVEEEQTEEESEEKAPLEEVAMMMADHIPDLSEDEALTMLERMDGDDDTADEEMYGDDEEDEEEEEVEQEEAEEESEEEETEEKSKEWQDNDSTEVEKDELPAWLRDDIDRKVSVKEQEAETEGSEDDDIPDWLQ